MEDVCVLLLSVITDETFVTEVVIVSVDWLFEDADDTTGVAGISTGIAWPFGNLKIYINLIIL